MKDVIYLFRQRSTRIYTIASNLPSYNIWISFKNDTAQNMKIWNLRPGWSQEKCREDIIRRKVQRWKWRGSSEGYAIFKLNVIYGLILLPFQHSTTGPITIEITKAIEASRHYNYGCTVHFPTENLEVKHLRSSNTINCIQVKSSFLRLSHDLWKCMACWTFYPNIQIT